MFDVIVIARLKFVSRRFCDRNVRNVKGNVLCCCRVCLVVNTLQNLLSFSKQFFTTDKSVGKNTCCKRTGWIVRSAFAVASPGFVARRGKAVSCVMGHSWWTSGSGGAAARWLIVLWLMQYWWKELWVVDICTSWSRRQHNIWIVGCQIYSKVN